MTIKGQFHFLTKYMRTDLEGKNTFCDVLCEVLFQEVYLNCVIFMDKLITNDVTNSFAIRTYKKYTTYTKYLISI